MAMGMLAIFLNKMYTKIREGRTRLFFGVVERSKIESFLVQIQFVLVLIVVFGLFHRLIAVTYAAIRETGQSQVNKIVFINNFV